MTKKTEVVPFHKELGLTESQLQIITNTIAKGATADELRLFMMVANKTGLDPFTRQIYFIKRKAKNPDGSYSEHGTIQTGIDGYRAIAEKSKTLAGIDDAVYDKEDGSFPNKASVTVYRMIGGEKAKFTASARMAEYCPINPKTGKATGMWQRMPFLMLAKCAEALALRKAFPNDLSGIYTTEEMQQADTTVEVVPEQLFEKAKAVVEQTTEVERLKTFATRLNDSKKYSPEEKTKLMAMVEEKIKAATPAVTEAAKSAELEQGDLLSEVEKTFEIKAE